MPLNDHFSDDYVAKLLAKDAKASTAKYSSYGLNALLPKRPTTNAPKPNTRFLQNIIKETDSHNAALRAKERAEAKDRLRRLRGDSEDDRDDDYGRLKRRRIDFNDEADLQVWQKHKKQKFRKSRDDDHERHGTSNRHRIDESSSAEDEARRSRRRRGRDHDSRRRSRKHRDNDHNHIGVEDGERSHRRRYRHRSEERNRHSQESKRRSRSPSPRRHHDHHHHRSRRRRHSSSPSPPPQLEQSTTNPTTNIPPSPPSPTSSDPLTPLLGPPPPRPLPRGRGTTHLTSSTIDTHFSPSYNPHLDTPSSHDDDDDWDQALEALKDRRRWKAMGAERLREAGFGDEVVEKWEGGGLGGGGRGGANGDLGGEGDVGSVKWRGRGEGREWDRGKVVTEDGVETGAEWGRLKGT